MFEFKAFGLVVPWWLWLIATAVTILYIYRQKMKRK